MPALLPTGAGDHSGEQSEGEVPAPADRPGPRQHCRRPSTRLAPQGSDAWNFLAAFTHLGDRYGPYQPGASALSDTLGSPGRADARRPGPLDRLRPRRDRAGRGPDGEKTELEETMGHVVEAFRFLSAGVEALEARLGPRTGRWRGRRGSSRLGVGTLAGPVAAHVWRARRAVRSCTRTVETAICCARWRSRAWPAHGVEPRGAVALRAHGARYSVTMPKRPSTWPRVPTASTGGVVLSGVVDRLPLHALLPLLAQSRRVLQRGAPLVVISEPAAATESRDAPARDLIDGHPLHEATWELVLDRAGFVEVGPLPDGTGQDRRIALSAVAPS